MERNLMIAGFGGQGVMLMGKLLSRAVWEDGHRRVSFFPSYGAEQRGGTANCYVVISDEIIGSPVGDEIDDLAVLNGPSLDKFLCKLVPGGFLYVNSSLVHKKAERQDVTVVSAPATELALRLGDPKVVNMIMLGLYVGHTKLIEPAAVLRALEAQLERKPKLIPLNRVAFEKGLALGAAQSAHP